MGEGIPEWVFWVSTALGTGLGAMVVRLGWKSGGVKGGDAPLKPDGTAYIDRVGVLVDNKTIEILAGSIEGGSLELLASRKAFVAGNDEMVRVAHKIVDELGEMRTDLRDVARALRDRK
jgi:hypothetical protein